ncbi:MAG TPA: type III pantothenate kinase [Steroidobacteraceae bacterium]|nr:type III pantothenate kinase [Steroidobacteraceae bacterium]
MSTLLVDIGNTRVKWALLRGARLGRMQALAHAGETAALHRLVRAAPRDVTRVVAVSVAGAKLERALEAAVRTRFGAPAEFVRSERHAAGVRNGYRDTWRLGADRWVGVIAAHHMAGARHAVVANIGTALTIDAVTADGRHLGGLITPGPSSMIDSLLNGTHGIRRRAAGNRADRPVPRGGFARDTAHALSAGATLAAAAVIDRAMLEAGAALRAAPLLLLTGGAARRLRRYIKSPCRVVPDLVLRGLGVLARG